MASRRDQVQSYQFFVQRMTSALVAREPDPDAAPFRRLGGAGLGGIMIAVLCLAAVGVYGLVRPGGSTSWKDGAAVIVEKETGTRYVYRDGQLHPVLNFSSALLALGSPVTKQVSRNSLTGTARGSRIGIQDAPDALPDPKRMLDGPWTLCSQPASNPAGDLVATTVLTVGRRPTGGREPGDAALLVRDNVTDVLYLVWHDHRHQIKNEEVVREGLTMTAEPEIDVGGAWLNALPAGEPIASRSVADRGSASTAVPDGVAGRVYVVESQSGTKQYYLATTTSLVPLTEVQASVLVADPATRTAYEGREPRPEPLAADAAAAARKTEAAAEGGYKAPATRPEFARLTGDRPAVCAEYQPGQEDPRVVLDSLVQPVQEPVRTAGRTEAGVPLADRVVIQPGFGALVEALPSPSAPTGTLNLVTDLGVRYPLSSQDVPAMLGYGSAKPVRLPVSLVVRLPSGPALDPETAKRPVDVE
jgi:ESX secretion system ATPase EccB